MEIFVYCVLGIIVLVLLVLAVYFAGCVIRDIEEDNKANKELREVLNKLYKQ